MLEFRHKFKSGNTSIFNDIKETMSEVLKESMRTVSHQRHTIRTYKLLKAPDRKSVVESKIIDIKNTLHRLYNRFELEEKRNHRS